MVTSCVAYGCSNESAGVKDLSFHKFPFRRPQVLAQWVEAIQRDCWYPKQTSRICGDHFLPQDYIQRPGLTGKFLKPDAVPSVFSFSHHSQPYNKRRKLLRTQPATTVPVTATNIPVTTTTVPIAESPSSSAPSSVITAESSAADAASPFPIKPSAIALLTKILLKPSTIAEATAIPPTCTVAEGHFNATNEVPSSSRQGERRPDCDMGTQTHNTEMQVHLLKRKIKTLRQSVRRKDRTIANMKRFIKEMTKRGFNRKNLLPDDPSDYFVFQVV